MELYLVQAGPCPLLCSGWIVSVHGFCIDYISQHSHVFSHDLSNHVYQVFFLAKSLWGRGGGGDPCPRHSVATRCSTSMPDHRSVSARFVSNQVCCTRRTPEPWIKLVCMDIHSNGTPLYHKTSAVSVFFSNSWTVSRQPRLHPLLVEYILLYNRPNFSSAVSLQSENPPWGDCMVNYAAAISSLPPLHVRQNP